MAQALVNKQHTLHSTAHIHSQQAHQLNFLPHDVNAVLPLLTLSSQPVDLVAQLPYLRVLQYNTAHTPVSTQITRVCRRAPADLPHLTYKTKESAERSVSDAPSLQPAFVERSVGHDA